jgi:hypothetical protein
MPDRKPLVTELKFQKEQMKLVNAALEDSATAIRQQILRTTGGSLSDKITRAQLRQQEAGIKAALGKTFDKFEDLLSAASEEMARLASEGISDYEEGFTELVLDPDQLKQLRASESRRVVNNIQQLISRNTTAQPGLSSRVYGTKAVAEGMVDKAVDRALAQGMNARQFANSVRSLIDPKVKGGVSYAAQRLARTEINNASHAAAVERYKHSFVDGVDWNLSGSHPEGDECDGLKDNSPYDTDNVPAKPHPQCFCYLTPALPSEEDFLNNLFDGKYDDGDEESPTKDALKEVKDTAESREAAVRGRSEEYFKNSKVLSSEYQSIFKRPIEQQDRAEIARVAAALKKAEAADKKAYDTALKAARFNKTEAQVLADEKAERAAKAAASKAAKEAKAAATTDTKAARAKAASEKAFSKVPKYPARSMEKAAEGTNPHGRGWPGYKQTLDRGYEVNCTRVSAAYELRSRGYDVQAAPAGVKAPGKNTKDIAANWFDPKTGAPRDFTHVNSSSEMDKGMAKYPEGSRFLVQGPWKEGGAHIWNAEIKGGKVIYREAQTRDGAYAANSYRGVKDSYQARLEYEKWKGTPGQPSFLRVDDLEPNTSLIQKDWIVVAKPR